MIVIKSQKELEQMRAAGRAVAATFQELKERIRPGITTAELDEIAAHTLAEMGAASPFKGYPNVYDARRPFPGAVCTSVNSELVHGVPGKRRLNEGDIVTIDCGAVCNGWIADSAWTFPVGQVSSETQDLLDATLDALRKAIEAARPGNRTGDVAAAMQQVVEARGYNVVRQHTSHGVGRHLHEDPQIPNHGRPGRGPRLRRGMTIALEPMVLVGGYETTLLDDGWTVASADGGLTAHFEHTVAITDGEAEIITKWET